mmetsp:Transcript_16939/g.43250  ORF Transcript_16939/g.43250 Transcript_16939/m.43250 type:complete len:213 (-) Transcript_16939:384-1022(-)
MQVFRVRLSCRVPCPCSVGLNSHARASTHTNTKAHTSAEELVGMAEGSSRMPTKMLWNTANCVVVRGRLVSHSGAGPLAVSSSTCAPAIPAACRAVHSGAETMWRCTHRHTWSVDHSAMGRPAGGGRCARVHTPDRRLLMLLELDCGEILETEAVLLETTITEAESVMTGPSSATERSYSWSSVLAGIVSNSLRATMDSSHAAFASCSLSYT